MLAKFVKFVLERLFNIKIDSVEIVDDEEN